jgi:uncharacterized membrane protein YkoI
MKSVVFASLFMLAATPVLAAQPGHYTGEKLAKTATITIDQAEDIALKARPGTVTDKELEKEKGGSGLRYSFDIKAADGKTYEVGVDAKTGEVLENGTESSASEAREAKSGG